MIDDAAIATLFTEARTCRSWQDRPVPETLLRRAYDLARLGPTSANCCPLRLVVVSGAAAKARLRPYLDPGNVTQTMAAPLTVILADDPGFPDTLARLYPHTDAKSWFADNPTLISDTAFRNATLQAGYLILALRALGLDCGPMSGFDAPGVATEFLRPYGWRPNFLLNIGYGDHSTLHPRLPRLDFDDIARYG